MNWKLKARIQNIVSLFPSELSYSAYYWAQRNLGSLRHVNPVRNFEKVVAAHDRIARTGNTLVGKTVFEVGTGRHLNMSTALWLLGASKISTLDRNPYLRPELVREHLAYVRDHEREIADIFGNRIHDDRLHRLVSFTSEPRALEDVLRFCGIDYVAPGDATTLPKLANATYDYHVSFNVFEHIPGNVVREILREGNRILKPTGLFVHRIDYSDHFSHDDPSISPINFLQFSARDWDRIAGNRYMYMNRLRVDDFRTLLDEVAHEVLLLDSDVDPSVRELLRSAKLKLDQEFASRSEEVLATTASWVVSRYRKAA